MSSPTTTYDSDKLDVDYIDEESAVTNIIKIKNKMLKNTMN